jgi:hypothetical protein
MAYCGILECRTLFRKQGKTLYCSPECVREAKRRQDAQRDAKRGPRRKCPACGGERRELSDHFGYSVCSPECGTGLFIRESPRFAKMTEAELRDLAKRAATLVHEMAYPMDVRSRGAEGRAGIGKNWRGLRLSQWPRKAIGASTADGTDTELFREGLNIRSATQAASIGANPDEGSTTWRPRQRDGLEYSRNGFEVPLPRLSEEEQAILSMLLSKAAAAEKPRSSVPEFATSEEEVA